MSDSFSFNGTKKNYLRVLKGRILPVLAPREHHLLTIPKRAGAIHQGTTTNIRSLEIPVLLEKTEDWTFGQLREDLAEWLTTEEAAPLQFDDEQGRTYFALLNDISNLEILDTDTATVTISFICPDPYKYSDEKRLFMPNGNGNGSKVYSVDNLGNIDTYPVIRLNVAKSINYFSVISGDDRLQIGEPVSIDSAPYEPETLVLWDQMNTISGWTQATNVDNGYIDGNITSNGYQFYAETVGPAIEPYGWQGPSLKKALPKALTNFRIEADVEMWNLTNKTGMLEIYLLNSSNEVVGKVGIEDYWNDVDKVTVKAKAGGASGGHWIFSGGADKDEWWNNFLGVIRLERVDNVWTVYASTVDSKTGVHTFPRGTNKSITYYDASGAYGSDVTQIQVAFRIFAGTDRAPMNINDIKVWELNERPEPTTPPIVAQAGDILEIDHYKNTVRRNGEILQGLKDFGSNFFPLKPGRNRLHVFPSDAGDVTVTYKERYL